MYAQGKNSKENKSRAVANAAGQKKHNGKADNRAEEVAQTNLGW